MPTLILNTFVNSTLRQQTDRVGHRVLKPFTGTGSFRRLVAPDSVDLYVIHVLICPNHFRESILPINSSRIPREHRQQYILNPKTVLGDEAFSPKRKG